MLHMPPEIPQRYSLHLDQVRGAVAVGPQFDPGPVAGVQFVFLCFTNRCGSNLVAETLASDGRLNLGIECWNADEVLRVALDQHVGSFQDYFAGVAVHGARGGRFVSKLAVEHLNLLHAAGVLDAIIGNSRFVMVERVDKLAQAISLAIATETSWWASYNEPARLPADVAFDRDKIDACLGLIRDQAALLDRFFALNGIEPVRVSYEEFVLRPDEATQRIGAALSMDSLRNVPANVRTTRQATATNQLWRDRYLSAPS